MNTIAAAEAINRYVGPFPEMVPRFIVIAIAVAILVICMVIYSHVPRK